MGAFGNSREVAASSVPLGVPAHWLEMSAMGDKARDSALKSSVRVQINPLRRDIAGHRETFPFSIETDLPAAGGPVSIARVQLRGFFQLGGFGQVWADARRDPSKFAV